MLAPTRPTVSTFAYIWPRIVLPGPRVAESGDPLDARLRRDHVGRADVLFHVARSHAASGRRRVDGAQRRILRGEQAGRRRAAAEEAALVQVGSGDDMDQRRASADRRLL